MVKALKILYDLFYIPIKWLDGVYKCNTCITICQFCFRLKWPKLHLLIMKVGFWRENSNSFDLKINTRNAVKQDFFERFSNSVQRFEALIKIPFFEVIISPTLQLSN